MARARRVQSIARFAKPIALAVLLVGAASCIAAPSVPREREPGIAPAPATTTVPVLFNHVFAQLDAETTAAITRSEIIAALGATETRTSHGTTETWTGFYIYGRETYVEIFGPHMGGAEGRTCGIGLSVERVGALDALRATLRNAGITLDLDQQDMQTPDGTIPWFRIGGVAGWPEEGPLSLWIGETFPSFMERRLAPRRVDPGDISRRTYLSTKFDEARLLEAVSGVRMRMPEAERDRFEAAMNAYGWSRRREGASVIAEGHGATIRVTGDAARRGLEELQMRLGRDVARREARIGRSTLTLGPGRDASWTFELK
jgi:hypothetical protein